MLHSRGLTVTVAGGTRYTTVQADIQAADATETNHRRPYAGCTINKIFVKVTANTMDGDGAVSLLVDGLPAVGATITIPATTTGIFTVTLSTQVLDGEQLSYKVTPAGTVGLMTCIISTSFL